VKGAGIYIDGPSESGGSFTGCNLLNNHANDGGGIYCSGMGGAGDGEHHFDHCLIANNSAETIGGGIDVLQTLRPLYLSFCRILDNRISSSHGGGGINVSPNGSIEANNTLIARNQETGVHIDAFGYAQLHNCTIADNRALGPNGGLYVMSRGMCNLSNSIVWGNMPHGIRGDADDLHIRYSDTQESRPGVGNISMGPRFRSHFGHDYLLAPDSPCIDSGDPELADEVYDTFPGWPQWYVDGQSSDMGYTGGPENGGWLQD
jgi:hypothetical protein